MKESPWYVLSFLSTVQGSSTGLSGPYDSREHAAEACIACTNSYPQGPPIRYLIIRGEEVTP